MFQQEIEPRGSEKVFSTEEIELMQKLGLTPEKIAILAKAADKQIKREEKRRSISFMAEYFLQHRDVCDLCEASVTTYFKMKREYYNGIEYLHSIPVEKETFFSAEKKEKRESKHFTCKCCNERLVLLSKEDLVALCIKLQKRTIK